jgi:hypothetical protein
VNFGRRVVSEAEGEGRKDYSLRRDGQSESAFTIGRPPGGGGEGSRGQGDDAKKGGSARDSRLGSQLRNNLVGLAPCQFLIPFLKLKYRLLFPWSHTSPAVYY